MATGDANDILRRVKAVIPFYWFASVAPLRDAVLGGLADGAAWCYGWITYARQQARIATATGPWLDLIAYDFLGRFLRRKGRADSVFRTLIQATILKERVTRSGMINALTQLTGYVPVIVEPWNTGDLGGYGMPTLGYGVAGGWGSMKLPGQIFLTVYLGGGESGALQVGGYGTPAIGYGVGINAYVGAPIEGVGVTNADIYATILATKPTGVICWTRIIPPPPGVKRAGM
jgi:hypothetical protein